MLTARLSLCLDYATSDVERACFSGVTTGRRDQHADTQREGTWTEAKPKERRYFLTVMEA